MIVNVRVAKDTFGRLVKRAEAGEEIIIARNGKPAVRMTKVADNQTPMTTKLPEG